VDLLTPRAHALRLAALVPPELLSLMVMGIAVIAVLLIAFDMIDDTLQLPRPDVGSPLQPAAA
jgi:hypothetical protein